MRSGNYVSIWNLLSNPGCSLVCCWNSWLSYSPIDISHTFTLPNIFKGEYFFNIAYGGFLMQFWRFSWGNMHAPVSQMDKHSYCLWDTLYVLWINFLMKSISICFLSALQGDDAHLVFAKHDTGTLFGGHCLFHHFSLSLVPCHCNIF